MWIDRENSEAIKISPFELAMKIYSPVCKYNDLTCHFAFWD